MPRTVASGPTAPPGIADGIYAALGLLSGAAERVIQAHQAHPAKLWTAELIFTALWLAVAMGVNQVFPTPYGGTVGWARAVRRWREANGRVPLGTRIAVALRQGLIAALFLLSVHAPLTVAWVLLVIGALAFVGLAGLGVARRG